MYPFKFGNNIPAAKLSDNVPYLYQFFNEAAERWVFWLGLCYILFGPNWSSVLVPLNWYLFSTVWDRCLEKNSDLEDEIHTKKDSVEEQLKTASKSRKKTLLKRKTTLEDSLRVFEFAESYKKTRAYQKALELFCILYSFLVTPLGWNSLLVSGLAYILCTNKDLGLASAVVQARLYFIDWERKIMQREKNTQAWDEFSKWLNKEHDELTLSEYAMKIVEYNSKKEKKTAQKSEEIPALIPENEHRRDAKEDQHHAQHVRNVDGNCVYVH